MNYFPNSRVEQNVKAQPKTYLQKSFLSTHGFLFPEEINLVFFPDVFSRKLFCEIFSRLEKKNFMIFFSKMFKFTSSQIDNLFPGGLTPEETTKLINSFSMFCSFKSNFANLIFENLLGDPLSLKACEPGSILGDLATKEGELLIKKIPFTKGSFFGDEK